MNDSFVNSLRINSQNTPSMLSDDEWELLREAYNTNKNATSKVRLYATALAALIPTLGMTTHMVDNLTDAGRILNGNSTGVAKDRKKYPLGKTTGKLLESLTTDKEGTAGSTFYEWLNTMKSTAEKAKTYQDESRKKASTLQREIADELDPAKFITNLRNNM